MEASWDEQVALVTGGSRGIGKAICRALAQAGVTVYLTARELERARQTCQELQAQGPLRVEPVALEVIDTGSVKSAVTPILEKHGRIDILVNSAGVTRDGLLMRMKDEDWNHVIGTNLTGTFNCLRQVVPAMVRRRYGRIINISSVVGQMGNPGQTNYVASKAGLIGLTMALARELASRSITVNAVAPGFVETDMTAGLDEKTRTAMLAGIPLGRAGNAEEVAFGVKFLASREASYITGHVLQINGGMHMG